MSKRRITPSHVTRQVKLSGIGRFLGTRIRTMPVPEGMFVEIPWIKAGTDVHIEITAFRQDEKDIVEQVHERAEQVYIPASS